VEEVEAECCERWAQAIISQKGGKTAEKQRVEDQRPVGTAAQTFFCKIF
jgi:hypothetical protein